MSVRTIDRFLSTFPYLPLRTYTIARGASVGGVEAAAIRAPPSIIFSPSGKFGKLAPDDDDAFQPLPAHLPYLR